MGYSGIIAGMNQPSDDSCGVYHQVQYGYLPKPRNIIAFVVGFVGGGYVLPMESKALLVKILAGECCTLLVQVGFHRGWMGLHHRHWTRK